MKNKFWKTIAGTLLGLLILVGGVVFATAVFAQQTEDFAKQTEDKDNSSNRGELRFNTLAGTWLVTVTRTNPPSTVSFLSLQTYSGDGAVLEESNNATVSRSLSQGKWERVGPRTFRRSWIYFRFDSFSAPRTFIGTNNNTATITLSANGNEFEAVAIAELRDAAGNLEATRTFSEVGRRF